MKQNKTKPKNLTNSEKEKQNNSKSASQDEKIIAAISHASIVFAGIIVPLIIWLIKKDESEFLDFQAKQALVYQVVVAIAGAILSIVGMLFSVLTLFFGMVIVVPLIILFSLGVIIYGLYAAYRVYIGEDFRYPWIADMLEQKT